MKVLVVDDEDTNALVLSKLLKKDNHEVFFAVDGKEAVEQFDIVNPDLVLMDVMMPNMDGYEATQIIKQKASGHFVPVIFITALENDEALVKCIESGGDDFISKPINVSILRAKICSMQRIRNLHGRIKEQNQQLITFQKRNHYEQSIAEQIFDSVMQKGDIESSTVHAYHKPAEQFNGDIVMAVHSPRGGMNVLVGDFTGHGLAAAICTMPVVEIFNKMSCKGYDIENIIEEISRKIREYLPKDRFLGACVMNINPSSKRMKVWNGGMPDVLIINEKTGVRLTIPSDQLPLGILPTSSINCAATVIELKEHDRVFAYSDGERKTKDVPLAQVIDI